MAWTRDYERAPDPGLVGTLARNWWAVALRGLLGICFGVTALVWPGGAILSLVLIFAVYAGLDGFLAVVSAVRAAEAGRRWGALATEGIAGVAFAILAAAWPGLTAVVFISMTGVWAIFTGALELVAAFQLSGAGGRWWLLLGGVASLLFGAALISAPMLGAIVLTWWLGVYALVFGALLVLLAFRLKAQLRQ